MKRLLLVGTRNGKPALHWPGILVTFGASLAVIVLVQFLLGRAWSYVFHDAERGGLGKKIWFGSSWSTFMVIWMVRLAWLRVKAMHDQMPPGPPVQPARR
jgi:hypothetical protein